MQLLHICKCFCRFVIFCAFVLTKVFGNHHNNEIDSCHLPDDLVKEIEGYAPVVNEIIHESTEGKFKRFVYNELSTFVDKFGNRLAGTKNLENSIDYMLDKLKEYKLYNVHGEEVTVPYWIRGNESATLIQPRWQNLAMMGLGDSVGTSPDGLTAEAIVVESFDELDEVQKKVPGKIVVFNEDWVSYGKTVQYRSLAARKVAAYDGVATLVRSVTPFSINSPHTGWQDYSDTIKKIPTASITVEDAHMLDRMYKRGDKLIINIKMEARRGADAISRNTVADIKGKEEPENVVLVSGHLDSWDVGQGAMDDGGGAFISWASLILLKSLNLTPRRTVRCVMWTAEEEGLVGAFAYAKQHQKETNNFNLLMESDEGTFSPLGLVYGGSEEGACIIEEILKLLTPINSTQLVRSDDVGSDISVWAKSGVPRASLLNKNKEYFWYHHTNGDSMDVEDPDALDRSLALWSAVAYVVADLSVDLPKD